MTHFLVLLLALLIGVVALVALAGAGLSGCGGGDKDRAAVEAEASTTASIELDGSGKSGLDGGGAPDSSPVGALAEIPCDQAIERGALGLGSPLPDGLGPPRCGVEGDGGWVVYPPAAMGALALSRPEWESAGGLSLGVGASAHGLVGASDADVRSVELRGVTGTMAQMPDGHTVVEWIDPEFGPAAFSSGLDAASTEIFLPLVAALRAT